MHDDSLGRRSLKPGKPGQLLQIGLAGLVKRVRRYQLLLRHWLPLKARSFAAKSSPNPWVIVLSLGSQGGSGEVARQASMRGLDVHVLCPEFPVTEAGFARGWTRLDPRKDYDLALEAARSINPVAILVEGKNLLLPMQSCLAEELNLVGVGGRAAKNSNSKLAMRQALAEAGLCQIPWVSVADYVPGALEFPAVMKPDLGTASKGVRLLDSPEQLELKDGYEEKLKADGSVGDRMLLESYVPGRQFDVEGIAINGTYYTLAVVEEFYEGQPPYFVQRCFHFNPPIARELWSKLNEHSHSALQALGVKNGAWHVEQRVASDGSIQVLDYANRMGYNKLVSLAAGVSFAGSYVDTLVSGEYKQLTLKPKNVVVLYAYDSATVEKIKKFRSAYPEHVHRATFRASEVSYHMMLGYLVVVTDNYASMRGMLEECGLLPSEFESFYIQG